MPVARHPKLRQLPLEIMETGQTGSGTTNANNRHAPFTTIGRSKPLAALCRRSRQSIFRPVDREEKLKANKTYDRYSSCVHILDVLAINISVSSTE
jgi:hypothetical protein